MDQRLQSEATCYLKISHWTNSIFKKPYLISFFSWGIIAIEKLCDISTKFSTEIIMEIKRDRYLNQLVSYMWDGQVKVITGIRRCGKSYLLLRYDCL